jgi:hypothetical protein
MGSDSSMLDGQVWVYLSGQRSGLPPGWGSPSLALRLTTVGDFGGLLRPASGSLCALLALGVAPFVSGAP